MKTIVAEIFKRKITKEQSKDTGMAMVLLLLLFSVILQTARSCYRGYSRFDSRHDGSKALPTRCGSVAGSLASLGDGRLKNTFDAGFLCYIDPDRCGPPAAGQ